MGEPSFVWFTECNVVTITDFRIPNLRKDTELMTFIEEETPEYSSKLYDLPPRPSFLNFKLVETNISMCNQVSRQHYHTLTYPGIELQNSTLGILCFPSAFL